MSNPRMTSTVEFGKALGVSENTVAQWIKDGVIEAVQPVPKGKWLVPVSEVDRLLSAARANRKSARTEPRYFNGVELVSEEKLDRDIEAMYGVQVGGPVVEDEFHGPAVDDEGFPR